MILIGAGNRHRHDDAAGLEVVRRLREFLPERVTLIEREGDLAGVIELWRDHDQAILIDAVSSGRSPGTIVRLSPARDPMPHGLCRSSSHGFGVAEAVALGAVLNVLPGQLTIFGIEGSNFDTGSGLSPAVAAAVDRLVRLILAECRARGIAVTGAPGGDGAAAGRACDAEGAGAPQRLRLDLKGAVQGVGFRPFVARLAREMELTGWVRNSPAGAEIEIEGGADRLRLFLARLREEKPPLAAIHGLETVTLAPVGHPGFAILESDQRGERTAVVLPDIATCPACRREIFDPADRRFRYPFTNCTNCGPRYSILLSLPYDRARTTMRDFPLCARCRREYDDPADRRYHAQPVACPECGPQLSLIDPGGAVVAGRDQALPAAAQAIGEGLIVAVQGVGGFHLMVDARNEAAVRRLRARKGREEKPFALLYPSLEAARADAEISPLEESLLTSPEAPIVLVRRRDEDAAADVAEAVAPNNPWLGIMLPSNPLHHLLTADLGFPVVATSGNLSEEPICHAPAEALERLAGVADLFLVHDRPIARPLDDSIVREAAGRAVVLRRGRGYAPLTLSLGEPVGDPVLAVGGHLKGTIALARGREVVLGEFLGDLESARTHDRFRNAIRDVQDLYNVHVDRAACDEHPEYPSTRHAETTWRDVQPVQHHHAHILACLADNDVDPPVLGVAWDGTGHGPDGTIWGGEFLRVSRSGFERVAHLRCFRLPGGEAAVREGRRAALGLLHEIFGAALPAEAAPVASFSRSELDVMLTLLSSGRFSPVTSSAGRLFDGLAALTGLRQRSAFEAQAAMELEFAALHYPTAEAYPDAGEDWEPLVRAVLADSSRGVDVGRIAARIHATLAEAIVTVARRAGLESVALSGGCFQNRVLLERVVRRLTEAGFRAIRHQRVPPNDAGIALGQVIAARRPAGKPDVIARTAPAPPVGSPFSDT